jgi:hypothetical protein
MLSAHRLGTAKRSLLARRGPVREDAPTVGRLKRDAGRTRSKCGSALTRLSCGHVGRDDLDRTSASVGLQCFT